MAACIKDYIVWHVILTFILGQEYSGIFIEFA